MTEYWFKPKAYGYGAAPANWKGWAVTLAFMAGMLVVTLLPVASEHNAPTGPGGWRITVWGLAVVIAAAGFVRLSRAKTDGQWAWSWGKLGVESRADQVREPTRPERW